MKYTIYDSAKFSLMMQLIIGIICLFTIFKPIDDKHIILNEILILETVVQFIEFMFYIWLIRNLVNIKYEVTPVRYLDWFITTPTMLFSFVMFFYYNNFKDVEEVNVNNVYNKKKDAIIKILLANAGMIIFGLLGELKQISKINALIIGFLFFGYCFYTIYEEFVGNNDINKYFFWINMSVWSIYGIAYMFDYKTKNIIYNLIDVVAKNFNGLFLFFYITFLI